MNKLAKVLMAETVALTSDRMFVEIRYKSLCMETYMVKQIISPPIKLFNLAEIFICKPRNNKILTWYGRRNETFFANRPLTGVTITFILCLYRVTGVWIGQGVLGIGIHKVFRIVRMKKVCSIVFYSDLLPVYKYDFLRFLGQKVTYLNNFKQLL